MNENTVLSVICPVQKVVIVHPQGKIEIRLGELRLKSGLDSKHHGLILH